MIATQNESIDAFKAFSHLKVNIKYILLVTISLVGLGVGLVFLLVPKFEGTILLTPGYVKYITDSMVYKDYFYSAKDLQVIIQHEYGYKNLTSRGIKIGGAEVIKEASQILKLDISGDSEQAIKDFSNEIVNKYSGIPDDKVKNFEGLKQKKENAPLVYSALEIVKTGVLRDLEVREARFRRPSFFIKLIFFATLIGFLFSSVAFMLWYSWIEKKDNPFRSH